MTDIQLEVAVIHVIKRNVSKVLTAAGKAPQPNRSGSVGL